MKKFSLIGGAAIAAMAMFQPAQAGVIIDIRVVGGDTANHKVVTAGEVVTLEVHALVTGAVGNAGSDGIQIVAGGFKSTGSLLGAINPAGDAITFAPENGAIGVGINGFNASGARVGTKVDLDSDTDLDLGKLGTVGTTASAQRAGAMVSSGTGVTAITDGVDVTFGKITFTVPAVPVGTETSITWGYASTGNMFTFQKDGATLNVSPTSNFSELGTPIGAVLSIPEPTSLSLLGLGALGLIRRRRA